MKRLLQASLIVTVFLIGCIVENVILMAILYTATGFGVGLGIGFNLGVNEVSTDFVKKKYNNVKENNSSNEAFCNESMKVYENN